MFRNVTRVNDPRDSCEMRMSRGDAAWLSDYLLFCPLRTPRIIVLRREKVHAVRRVWEAPDRSWRPFAAFQSVESSVAGCQSMGA